MIEWKCVCVCGIREWETRMCVEIVLLLRCAFCLFLWDFGFGLGFGVMLLYFIFIFATFGWLQAYLYASNVHTFGP